LKKTERYAGFFGGNKIEAQADAISSTLHNAERYTATGMCSHRFADHFPADKNENTANPSSRKRKRSMTPAAEIERSQPQNREHVRSVDNKRILGNAKHRGMESTASVTSVISTTRRTRNNGVANSLPAWRTKKCSPWYHDLHEDACWQSGNPALLRMNISFVIEEHANAA